MRRALLAVLASSAALLAPAGAQAATTGRILVRLEPQAAGTASAASAVASAAARPDGQSVPALRLLTVRPRAGTSLAATLRALRADPRVRSATPEQRFAPRALPDDPALTLPDPDKDAPAGTQLEWTLPREGFATAWDLSAGVGATVAVIDSGVDASHPDLQGKIADAIDFDDVQPGPATADPDGHGTHVASLACASTNNALGIAGAGRDCRLLVIRSDFSEGSIIAGLVAAAQRGAQAINMSFGGSGVADPALGAALHYAVKHGAVPVAAAADAPVEDQGQPASMLQPAGTGAQLGHGLGLVVTAATGADARASFAGYGSEVSMAAYGTLTDGDQPARHRRRLPGGHDRARVRRQGPQAVQVPRDDRRRLPLRVPGRHLDGRAAGDGRRRADARGQPAAARRPGRPAAEVDRPPSGRHGLERRPRLGDPRRGRRRRRRPPRGPARADLEGAREVAGSRDAARGSGCACG